MPLIVPVGASNTSSNIYNLLSLSPYGCYKLAVRTHIALLSSVFYLNPLVLAHLSKFANTRLPRNGAFFIKRGCYLRKSIR